MAISFINNTTDFNTTVYNTGVKTQEQLVLTIMSIYCKQFNYNYVIMGSSIFIDEQNIVENQIIPEIKRFQPFYNQITRNQLQLKYIENETFIINRKLATAKSTPLNELTQNIREILKKNNQAKITVLVHDVHFMVNRVYKSTDDYDEPEYPEYPEFDRINVNELQTLITNNSNKIELQLDLKVFIIVHKNNWTLPEIDTKIETKYLFKPVDVNNDNTGYVLVKIIIPKDVIKNDDRLLLNDTYDSYIQNLHEQNIPYRILVDDNQNYGHNYKGDPVADPEFNSLAHQLIYELP